MKKIKNKQILSMVYIIHLVIALLVVADPSMVKAAEPVNLYSATSFGVLAGSTITNTGTTAISGTAGGDIGLHPGTSFTGQASVTQSGTIHLADSVAQQAKADLLVAYGDAESRVSTQTITADLGGTTLSPGVYNSASSISLTGTLTLDGGGDPNAVFIFQAGTTLTTATNSEIVLINGAQPCNVFWQVGTSATLGTTSTFVGHILALESITATTGAVIYGSLLAYNGAVTLDTNTIVNDVCLVLGSLSVTKVVAGDVTGVTLPDFVITISGPNNYSDTQTIASGASYTWSNLTAGTYTVSEATLSQEWEATGVGEYTVVNGELTAVTVTNTHTPPIVIPNGGLTVTKVVAGDVDGLVLPDFVITVEGPDNYSDTQTIASGASYTWSNLTAGTYTVSEATLSQEWEATGLGEYTVTNGELTAVTVTNTYTPPIVTPNGGLTVTKVVAGDVDGLTLPDFVITISGPNNYSDTQTIASGASYTWSDLTAGTYTVSEATLSQEWEAIGVGEYTVTNGELTAVTITNTYTTPIVIPNGGLTVTKVVAGDVDGLVLPDFMITVEGPDSYSDTQTIASGASYTWSDLTAGTYTVSEATLSQEWKTTGLGEYTVVNGELTAVTVTNTYTTPIVISNGGLTVTKVVAGDVDGLVLPDFVITVEGPDNYSDTQPIASGASYTWSDLVPGEYTISESRVGLSDEWTVSGESTVQVLSDQTIVLIITNQYTKTDTDVEIKIVDTSDDSGWLINYGLILLGAGLFILKKWK